MGEEAVPTVLRKRSFVARLQGDFSLPRRRIGSVPGKGLSSRHEKRASQNVYESESRTIWADINGSMDGSRDANSSLPEKNELAVLTQNAGNAVPGTLSSADAA